MAFYNLTDKQKYLLTTIVKHIKAGQLDEPIIPACSKNGGCRIIGLDEQFGHNLLGDLDALCDVDLMGFRYNSKGNKIYSIKQAGYDAIENNFVMPKKPASVQLNIGTVVHEMKGGTLQTIGFANESEVKQVVNDPEAYQRGFKQLLHDLQKGEETPPVLPARFEKEDARQSLRRQLAQHRSNLNKLKEDAAIYGVGEVPLRLQNQMEREQQAIKEFEAEIAAIEEK